MKSIAFIELDTHAEIAGNIADLVQCYEGLDMHFFVSPKIYSRLHTKDDSRIIKTAPEQLLERLSTTQFDLVIIGTAHRHYGIWNDIAARFPTAVLIHNRNFAGLSSASLFSRIWQQDTLFRLKLLFREKLLAAPEFYRKCRTLFVLDNALVNENLKLLPVFFQKFDNQFNSDELNVVIPGTVDQHRRDYAHIFRILKSVKFARAHHFVFLGKADVDMQQKLSTAEKHGSANNFSLAFYREKVSTEEFGSQMQQAHVLWCPLQQETQFFSGKEVYGLTKMSGNFGDAVKFGKPAIFPEWYQSMQPFIFREDSDPATMFERVAAKKVNFAGFSKAEIQKQFETAVLASISG